jgi:trimeric autotransporter adhesin
MFSPLRNGAGKRLREPFGKAGLTVAVIALVFAMLGGAYAASNDDGGGKATASAKAKQGPRGPRGKTGPAGPAGPQGPAGANGAKGDAGAKGDKGDAGNAGSAGAAGKSVVSAEEPSGANCEFGGSRFEVQGSPKTYACNGEPGEEGPEGPKGDPWSVGGTLPVGATETGVWGMGSEGEGGSEGSKYFPISFTVPLKKAPEPVFVPNNKESEPGCPGRGGGPFPPSGEYRPTIPMADPGKLCVYAGSLQEATFEKFSTTVYELGSWFVEPGAAASGTVLEIDCKSKFCSAMGSWAVTASE